MKYNNMIIHLLLDVTSCYKHKFHVRVLVQCMNLIQVHLFKYNEKILNAKFLHKMLL